MVRHLWRKYASAYRGGAGKNLKNTGLAKFTVLCYFLANSMVMATCALAATSLTRFQWTGGWAGGWVWLGVCAAGER